MDFIPETQLIADAANYPKNLTEAGIRSTLNVLGNFDFSKDAIYVGVIGSRKASIYGSTLVNKIVTELVYNGSVIVSGFMYGIDIAAHNRALECGGHTVCVLGYGFEHLFKTQPKYVIEDFSYAGAFITEYEYSMSPKKWTFASRNKIIAGLCSLLIVVEAEQKSGSFITCYWAHKFNRQVYAVPGSILSEKSMGTNNLIKNSKALMLNTIEEIPQILGVHTDLPNDIAPDSDNECQQILNVLTESPLGFDELAKATQTMTKLPLAIVAEKISLLELGRKIRRVGNIYYVA